MHEEKESMQSISSVILSRVSPQLPMFLAQRSVPIARNLISLQRHTLNSTIISGKRLIHQTPRTMSSSFTQAPHKLLVIPGPIEFSDPVLLANATPGTSHVSPAFVPVFGDCLRMLRKVVYAEKEGNQAMLISGSGTMGWDAVGANLIEPGEQAVSQLSATRSAHVSC